MYDIRDVAEPLFEVSHRNEGQNTNCQATTAVLRVNTGDGIKPEAMVVDSGAAWTAISYEYIKDRCPSLLPRLERCPRMFQDASRNNMPVVGQLPMEFWLGDQRIRTTAIIFANLGANILLGTQTMKSAGIVIDIHSDELKVHKAVAVPGCRRVPLSCRGQPLPLHAIQSAPINMVETSEPTNDRPSSIPLTIAEDITIRPGSQGTMVLLDFAYPCKDAGAYVEIQPSDERTDFRPRN
jgi:hypothetical protein